MVIRPIESPVELVNHSAPSAPVVIPHGPEMPVPVWVLTVPVVVIRPIELPAELVNHSAPSRPAAIPAGCLMLGAWKADLTWPLAVIRPIELPVKFAYHNAPSGPATIPRGPEKTREEYSLTVPAWSAAGAAAAVAPAVSVAAATATTVTARYVRLTASCSPQGQGVCPRCWPVRDGHPLAVPAPAGPVAPAAALLLPPPTRAGYARRLPLSSADHHAIARRPGRVLRPFPRAIRAGAHGPPGG